MLSRTYFLGRCWLYRCSVGPMRVLKSFLHDSTSRPTRTIKGKPANVLEEIEHAVVLASSQAKSKIVRNRPKSYRKDGEIQCILLQEHCLDQPASFETIYLRDACLCSRCIDPSTSQKLFESADIPLNIDVEKVQYLSDGTVQITWDHDIPGYEHHISTFSPAFLQRTSSAEAESRRSFPQRVPWDRATFAEHSKCFAYSDYLCSSKTLHEALNQLHCYGIVFLQSVPSEPSAIERIAEKIGPLRNTFYGPTWDVRSLPSAKNVAYTSQELGFHMDLLYMADPPGVQILHAMKASASGGESLFSDGMKALYSLRHEPAETQRVLRSHRVTYRYKNDGHWYQYRRPTVEGAFYWDSYGCEISCSNANGAEASLSWSPPFQAPFDYNPRVGTTQSESKLTNLSDYIKAAHLFKSSLEDSEAVFETKMQEGTCVIFDNRRILHARKAYTSDSERWLRGAYVDKDPLKSRLRVLNAELGVPELRPPGMRGSFVESSVESDFKECGLKRKEMVR